MATRKYPPRDDEGLLAAANQFADNIDDPTEIGLTADDMTRLTTARTSGQAAFDKHRASQIQARSDTNAKDAALDLVEDILQEFNGRVQNHPNLTDSRREALGLPVYDAVKTSAPAPTELPVVTIDTSTPLHHIIRFKGEGKEGKPEGAKALEIYVKIGGDATGIQTDYNYQGQDSEPPYTKEFQPADSGKQAHYLFCWINSAGARGPWAMHSATVTSQLQSQG